VTAGPVSRSLRGADIVARSLERLGCRHVFTLSGNHIMSIFDAAIETNLDLVHVRHVPAVSDSMLIVSRS
jgi:acetolactate synthase I/II/III large subunit